MSEVQAAAGEALALVDAPLAPFQGEQLDLAFEAANAIPAVPHIKKRSKAQEDVVMACLRLDQPARAARYMDGILDWRRGLCCAELAFHLAERGNSHVQPLLDLASRIADTTEEWRRDRVRVRIAQVHALLGQDTKAAEYSAGADASENGKVETAAARAADDTSFESSVAALNAVVAADKLNIEACRNALGGFALLHDRFYADAERRNAVEQSMRASWNPVPLFVRLEVLMGLAETAVKHGDSATASRFVGEAAQILAMDWRAEDRMKYAARLVELRHRTGDPDAALREADELLAFYERESASIFDVWRAGALRPLAESFHAMGLRERAVETYAKAIEAGALNSNVRPRAEDLSATLCSMAVHGFDPGPELRQRMQDLAAGLVVR